MDAVSAEKYCEFLAEANIKVAAPQTGIGNQLTYAKDPLRTVVVHFAESDTGEHLDKVMQAVLRLEDTWLLVPRYGRASDLGLIPDGGADIPALCFGVNDRSRLAEYLCTRPMELGTSTADLYAISGSGNILVSWDHHTAEEGLDIQLMNVKDASRLLVALNELGAEVEVYYAGG